MVRLIEFLTSPDIRRAHQQRIDWDHTAWTSGLGHLHSAATPTLDALERSWAVEDGISRAAVRKVGGSDPVALLVASMAWGFGALPYGPARTAKMLAPGAEEHAAAIIEAAQCSPADGFRALFRSRRPVIRGLSIAMGSKLLYFAAPPHDGAVTPVVYDQTVFKALSDFGFDVPDPAGYMTGDQYQDVCGTMKELADKAGDGRRCDDIEYALFQYPRWARRQESLKTSGKRR